MAAMFPKPLTIPNIKYRVTFKGGFTSVVNAGLGITYKAQMQAKNYQGNVIKVEKIDG